MMTMTYSFYRKFSLISSLKLTWSWKPTSSLTAIPSETFFDGDHLPDDLLTGGDLLATTVSQTTSLPTATFSQATPP